MEKLHMPTVRRPHVLVAAVLAVVPLLASPLAASGDPHSYSRPDEVAVRHLTLDLAVDFEARRLEGTASWTIERTTAGAETLFLDTKDLEILSVRFDDGPGLAPFRLADDVPFLGRALSIDLSPTARVVHVDYRTDPGALALQWLERRMTAGGKHPFLFSQSQAILARTWVPCQDSPGVRFTYDATLRVPAGLLALMSAENPQTTSPDGVYRFRMPQAIPSYLLAIAVGDLEFRSLGPRSGVYAEPPVVESAAWELADTEAMIRAAEKLYGPYRWGRYDLLVLPPSFPFGGMENPRLTFATPTILAGDRSLVALIAHELAHSWSGNLVTNATWNDFWLNEGFTSYFENRIMEAVYGVDTARMLQVLSRRDLDRSLAEVGAESRDSWLYLDLTGRNPDDGMSGIAYDKGALLLYTLEATVGRPAFDAYLKRWFSENAFRSKTSRDFVDDVRQNLLDPKSSEAFPIDAWVYGPGVPEGAFEPTSETFAKVEAEAARFEAGIPAGKLATTGWGTNHWLRFLDRLPESLPTDRLADLDAAFGFTGTGNSEIAAAWFRHTIRSGYAKADPALESFLVRVGRMKFVVPLFRALSATEAGRARATAIFEKARPGYHPLTVQAVEKVLGEMPQR